MQVLCHAVHFYLKDCFMKVFGKCPAKYPSPTVKHTRFLHAVCPSTLSPTVKHTRFLRTVCLLTLYNQPPQTRFLLKPPIAATSVHDRDTFPERRCRVSAVLRPSFYRDTFCERGGVVLLPLILPCRVVLPLNYGRPR